MLVRRGEDVLDGRFQGQAVRLEVAVLLVEGADLGGPVRRRHVGDEVVELKKSIGFVVPRFH